MHFIFKDLYGFYNQILSSFVPFETVSDYCDLRNRNMQHIPVKLGLVTCDNY